METKKLDADRRLSVRGEGERKKKRGPCARAYPGSGGRKGRSRGGVPLSKPAL